VTLHPTHAVIDLGALRHNLGIIRDLVGTSVGIMAVVKSNAYGHGVKHIALEALSAGVACLAVARVDEGLELRRFGIEARILVFEIPSEGQLEQAVETDLELMVTSRHGARAISETGGRIRRTTGIHVKIDTGMGRLGFPVERAAEKIEQLAMLKHVRIASIWSHFSNAESPNTEFAMTQLGAFNNVLAELDRRKVQVPVRHMANSAAILNFPEARFDMVRPGIMLYGHMASEELESRVALRPVMSVVSRVSFLKKVAKGTRISYGGTYVTPGETTIATIPIGYADGFPRGLSNRGSVLIRGSRYPVVGTVTMDHIMADVGPDPEVSENDPVTIIGMQGSGRISAREIADLRETISYEILCGISPRVPRIVK